MPLKIRTEVVCENVQPFIIRICDVNGYGTNGISDQSVHGDKYDARITHDDSDCVHVSTSDAQLIFHGVKAPEILGDILLVVPSRGISSQLIRASSMHNTLLITEQCDQLCVMCSQPPKKYHADWFEHYKIAISLCPLNSMIGLSGGEPTLYKHQLFELVEDTFQYRPDVKFHILTNAQHFNNDDTIYLQRASMKNVCWGVPLYSHDSFVHDEIVGKHGAFDRLIPNLQRLIHSPASVELRTVLVKKNYEQLKTLAEFICVHLRLIDVWAIMQLEYIGYAKMNWDTIFVDTSISFKEIGLALDHCSVRGINPILYNFPRCTVPEPYRYLATNSISDWKQKYITECSSCTQIDSCGGFFQWYETGRGYSKIRSL